MQVVGLRAKPRAAFLSLRPMLGAPLLFILVAVPVRVPLPGPFHSVSIFELALPLIFAAELSQERRPGAIRLSIGVALTASLFVAWIAVSGVWTVNRLLWLRQSILLAESIGVAATVLLWSRRRDDTEIWRFWMFLGLVAAIEALAWYYLLRQPETLNLTPPLTPDQSFSQEVRLGSPFWGPSNYFASMMLLFFPFALNGRASSRLRLALLFVTGIAIGATLSRGALIAVVTGPAVAALLVRAEERHSLTRQQILAGVALLIPFCLVVLLAWMTQEYISTASGPTTRAEVSAGPGLATTRPDLTTTRPDLAPGFFNDPYRRAYIQQALHLLAKRPVVGYGYGTWSALVNGNATKGAHDYYLQIAVETGLIGLGLFLLFLFAIINCARRLGDGLGLATTAVLVAVAVNIGVEASFEGAIFSWLFGMLVGGILASRAEAL